MINEDLDQYRDYLAESWVSRKPEYIFAADHDMNAMLAEKGQETAYLPKPYMGLAAVVNTMDGFTLSIDDDSSVSYETVCVLLPHIKGYGTTKESALKALLRGLESHHVFLKTFPCRSASLDLYRDILEAVVAVFPDRAPTLRKKRAPNKKKEEYGDE